MTVHLNHRYFRHLLPLDFVHHNVSRAFFYAEPGIPGGLQTFAALPCSE